MNLIEMVREAEKKLQEIKQNTSSLLEAAATMKSLVRGPGLSHERSWNTDVSVSVREMKLGSRLTKVLASYKEDLQGQVVEALRGEFPQEEVQRLLDGTVCLTFNHILTMIEPLVKHRAQILAKYPEASKEGVSGSLSKSKKRRDYPLNVRKSFKGIKKKLAAGDTEKLFSYWGIPLTLKVFLTSDGRSGRRRKKEHKPHISEKT